MCKETVSTFHNMNIFTDKLTAKIEEKRLRDSVDLELMGRRQGLTGGLGGRIICPPVNFGVLQGVGTFLSFASDAELCHFCSPESPLLAMYSS